MACLLLRIALLVALSALCGCGFQGAISPVISGALGGLGVGVSAGTPSGSAAISVILQEAQDIRNLELGLAAINQGSAAMMLPMPVVVTPVGGTPMTPPVVVNPAPTPSPSGPLPTGPTGNG